MQNDSFDLICIHTLQSALCRGPEQACSRCYTPFDEIVWYASGAKGLRNSLLLCLVKSFTAVVIKLLHSEKSSRKERKAPWHRAPPDVSSIVLIPALGPTGDTQYCSVVPIITILLSIHYHSSTHGSVIEPQVSPYLHCDGECVVRGQCYRVSQSQLIAPRCPSAS